MKTYRYSTFDPTVVLVFDEDSVCRLSMLASLVPDGAAIEPADPPPPPSPDEVQEALATAYAPLRTLAGMTQAEIDAHIDATFPNLTAAQRQALNIYGRGLVVLLRHVFSGRLG